MTLRTNQPSDFTPQDSSPDAMPVSAVPIPPAEAASNPTAPVRGLTALPAVLLVVLLAVAATFVGYKISNDQRAADQQSRIEALERDLKAKNHELNIANDDLGETDECLDVVRALLNSADEDSARRAVRLMVKKCQD
jgi:hypothetical protein